MDFASNTHGTTQPLGSLLYTNEKKTGQRGVIQRFCAYAGFTMAAAIFLMGLFLHQPGNWNFVYIGSVILALSIWNYISYRSAQGSYLRVYEKGIEIQQKANVHRFEYQNLKAMAFSSVKKFVNGAYVGHEYNIVFRIKNGDQETSLRWSSIDNDSQEGLDALRQRLSLLLAHKMVEELEATGSIDWVEGVTIQDRKITFRPTTLLGKSKQWQELLFSDIARAEFDELGSLAIYRKGERKPTISIATDQLNFHPGYLLFRNSLKTCGTRTTEGSAVH